MVFNKNIEIISLLFEIYNEENSTKEDILHLLKIFQNCECDDEIILNSLHYIKRYKNLIEVLDSIKLIFDFNSGLNIIHNYLKLLPLLKNKSDFQNFQTLLVFLKECRELKEKYNGKFKLPNFVNLSDKLDAIIFDPDLLPEIQETLICTFAPDLNPNLFKPRVKEVIETIYGPDFNLYCRDDISHYKDYISFEYFEDIFDIYYITPLIKFQNYLKYKDCYVQKYIQHIINLKPEDVHKKIEININVLNGLLADCLRIKNGFEVIEQEKQPHERIFTINLFEAYFEKNNDTYEINGLYLNRDWIPDEQNQSVIKFTKEKIRYDLKQTFYLSKLIDIRSMWWEYNYFNKLLQYEEYKIFNFDSKEKVNYKYGIFKLNIRYDKGDLIYTYINEYDEKNIKIIRKQLHVKFQTVLEQKEPSKIRCKQKEENAKLKYRPINKSQIPSDSDSDSDLDCDLDFNDLDFSDFSSSSDEF